MCCPPLSTKGSAHAAKGISQTSCCRRCATSLADTSRSGWVIAERGVDAGTEPERRECGRARSTSDQYDPHAIHRRGPTGEVGPSGYANGAGTPGLHDLEPVHAVRSAGPDLAESRPLRSVKRPRLDAAVVRPVLDGDPRGECGV